MEEVSRILHDHYRKTFLQHGATSKGVDWGDKEWAAVIRQNKMLEVINELPKPETKKMSLLDVGCGYGSLADIIKEKSINISYTGIDLVEEMVTEGRIRHPEHCFFRGDVMEHDIGSYDYVVCNGILTQKVSVSILAMNQFAQKLIRKMFAACNYGIAFNLMSTYVNFQRENLYYRNPAELIAWCMSELTPHVKIDCAYDPWFEYTLYLYKPTAVGR